MGGETYAEDSLLVAISGRYEYSNKGIDVFLDALGRVAGQKYQGHNILAFVMVPSGNNGPDKELLACLDGNTVRHTTQTSHYLMDDYDIVMRRLRAKYPNLLIDNCASGGRRLDIELNSRSHCYCRSDFFISYRGEDQILSARAEIARKGIYCEHTTAANYAAYLEYCRLYGPAHDCLITMCGAGLKSDH